MTPGARCPSGRSIGSGAPQAVQWTACVPSRTNHARNAVIRPECWSRGRIVSALLSAAQGGCLPSMEHLNPDAAKIGPPAVASKGCGTIANSAMASATDCMLKDATKMVAPGLSG